MLIFNREFIFRHRYIIIYLSGVLAGALILNIFYESMVTQIISYGKYVFGRVENGYSASGSKSVGVFLSVFAVRFKEISLLIIFAHTIFSGIYCMYYIFSKGLSVGITFSLSVMCYGTTGILKVVLSVISYIVPYVVLIIAALNYAGMVKIRAKSGFAGIGKSIAPLLGIAALIAAEALFESIFLFRF